jgi:hypothetical protein
VSLPPATLARLAEAYAAAAPSGPTGVEVSLQARYEAMARERLAAEDVAFVANAVDGAQRVALDLARAGRLGAAWERFAEVAELIEGAACSEEAKLLAASGLLSALAYYEYRAGEWQLAVQRVGEAMRVDRALEDRGYHFLQLHRIQLVHNLIRIHARRRARADAIALADRTLLFLDGRADSLPVDEAWDAARLATLPANLRWGLGAQAASEVVLLQPSLDELRAFDAWRGFGEGHPLVAVRGWVETHGALLRGEQDEFARGAELLLRLGRHGHALDFFWYSTAVDLALFCAAIDLPEARQLSSRITADGASWPRIAQRLLPGAEP